MSATKRRRPGASAGRLALFASPMIGLGVAVLVVWQSSYSAFTATTNNGVNNWAAGNVVLSDNDNNNAMFNVTMMEPGSTGHRCITVTSTGTVPSDVRLYGTGLTSTKNLSAHLDLVVTQGSGTQADCGDFSALGAGSTVYSNVLAGFTAADFASGYGNWAPTGSAAQSRTYRFDWTMNHSATNAQQGGSAAITFVWEAQS